MVRFSLLNRQLWVGCVQSWGSQHHEYFKASLSPPGQCPETKSDWPHDGGYGPAAERCLFVYINWTIWDLERLSLHTQALSLALSLSPSLSALLTMMIRPWGECKLCSWYLCWAVTTKIIAVLHIYSRTCEQTTLLYCTIILNESGTLSVMSLLLSSRDTHTHTHMQHFTSCRRCMWRNYL